MSGGFTDKSLERKLADLNNTAPSIQQLSLWLVHHKKHYSTIVHTWHRELVRAEASRKLTYLYLANDVVQNVRKNKPEFVTAFGDKMIEVFNHLSTVSFEDRTASSFHRLLLIWEERQIFDRKLIAILTSIWKNRTGGGDRDRHTPPPPPLQKRERSRSPVTPPLPVKKPHTNGQETHKQTEDRLSHMVEEEEEEEGRQKEGPCVEEGRSFEAELDPDNGDESFTDPPDTEELILAIQGLEDTATSDAEVRQEISKLPPEVSELSTCSKISNPEDGEKTLLQVQSARKLLEDYNERLEAELRERRRVGRMIYEFLSAQRILVSGLEERIDTYKDKLDKVRSLEEEVRKHLASLPNIPEARAAGTEHPFK